MNESSICPACGAPLAQGNRAGMCPACLLHAALVDDSTQVPEPTLTSDAPEARVAHPLGYQLGKFARRNRTARRVAAGITALLVAAMGEGVAKDELEAVKWFRKAAGQNFAPAQYNLSLCFRGVGAAQDFVEAYKWMLLAAAQGDEKAKDSAGLVELVLTPDQIADGKRRAKTFKPQERTQP